MKRPEESGTKNSTYCESQYTPQVELLKTSSPNCGRSIFFSGTFDFYGLVSGVHE